MIPETGEQPQCASPGGSPCPLPTRSIAQKQRKHMPPAIYAPIFRGEGIAVMRRESTVQSIYEYICRVEGR